MIIFIAILHIYPDKSASILHFYQDKSVLRMHFYLDKSVVGIHFYQDTKENWNKSPTSAPQKPSATTL